MTGVTLQVVVSPDAGRTTRGKKMYFKCGVIEFVPVTGLFGHEPLDIKGLHARSAETDGHEGYFTSHHDFVLLHVSSGTQSCLFP